MIEFGYAIKRANKLFKTLNQLISRVEELKQTNNELRKRCEGLENQLNLRARWDKENLPDDQQTFIKDFMNKYDTQDKTSQ